MANFDPEEAVWAVSDAGSLTGRVGDLGFGLTKPVCGGDAWILVLAGRAVVDGWAVDFEVWLVAAAAAAAAAAVAGFLVALLSAAFEDASLKWPGVVGVLGIASFTFLGDALGATDVFAVDIAAGRVIVLSVVGLSDAFARVAVFELPFVLPFEVLGLAALPVIAAAAFFASSSPLAGLGVPRLPAPSCLSTSAEGVSRAFSGMMSSTTTLFLRAMNSSVIDSFLCASTPDSSCSSVLKLSLRFARLGSPLLSRFGNWSPIWPLFSTITKLVRILEMGRGDVLSLPVPRTISRCLGYQGQRDEVTDPLTRPLVTALSAQAGWWTDLCSRTSPAGCARRSTSWLISNGVR